MRMGIQCDDTKYMLCKQDKFEIEVNQFGGCSVIS